MAAGLTNLPKRPSSTKPDERLRAEDADEQIQRCRAPARESAGRSAAGVSRATALPASSRARGALSGATREVTSCAHAAWAATSAEGRDARPRVGQAIAQRLARPRPSMATISTTGMPSSRASSRASTAMPRASASSTMFSATTTGLPTPPAAPSASAPGGGCARRRPGRRGRRRRRRARRG